MKKTKNISKYFIQTFIFLILYFCVFTIVGVCLDFTKQQFVYHSFLLIIFAFLLLFSYFYSEKNNLLIFYRLPSFRIFLICFILVFTLSNLTLFLPIYTIPFCLFALILVFSSNFTVGFISYFFLILFQTLVNQWDINICISLLFIGLCCCMIYSYIGKPYRYGGSLICSIVLASCILSLLYLLTNNSDLNVNDFLLYLAIQIFVTFVLSLIFLKTFANLVVFKDDHFFRQINDPEYPLLSRLKEIDKTAYYHAIHVAYFSDKIARRLGVNCNSTKALGYYHRIGLLKGNETIQNTLLVASANYFPKSLILLMKEYGVKNWDSISKEATIVQISESVVSSIMYLFDKDPDTSLNYEQIVDLIIKKKLQKGEFSKSKLTLEELNFVKKVFTEEKLYYDFLR